MRRRIGTLVIFILLVLTIFLPITQTVASVNTNRTWSPGLSIKSIALKHFDDEPTDFFNEYINKPREVVITIENTGSVVLTNLNISYEVKRGMVVDLSGEDISKTKLKISEVYRPIFDWTPAQGGGTQYTIKVTVTADNFGKIFGPIETSKEFTIKDVKKDVGPINYYFAEPATISGDEYANKSHNLNVIVKNFGNFDLSDSFLVSASIISPITLQEFWNDSTTVSVPIPANKLLEVELTKPWQPPNSGSYLLNISTSLAGDIRLENDKIVMALFNINNVIDAGIIAVNNFIDGGIYPCTPMSVSTRITNTGNLNITTPFSATLQINSYPSGTNVYTPPSEPIPIMGPQNITEPGKNFDAVFSEWNYANGLTSGKFWLNITINLVELNGSIYNNDHSILIELKNWTNIELEFVLPKAGLYYVDDITEVVVNVSNTGTQDLPPFILRLTAYNKDSNETWLNYSGQSEPNGLLINSYKHYIFPGWNFVYNANFELTVILAYSAEPSIIKSSSKSVFELGGGEVNGTVTGFIFDADEGEYLEGIKIKFYFSNLLLKTTNITASDGSYSVKLPAIPAGEDYIVMISENDNYWWFEESKEIKVYSGRTKYLNLTLNRRPTGRLKGMVKLTPPPGAPNVIEDWTGITLSIENTPITFSADNMGNFNIELVAEVINVTAFKSNFKDARLEYVTVIPGQTSSIELTLVEAWNVIVSPTHDEKNVDPRTSISAEFSTKLNTSTVTSQTFGLIDDEGKLIEGITRDNYRFLRANKTCLLMPPKLLKYNSTYQVVIKPGITTLDGSSAIHRKWVSRFTTDIGFGSVAGYCSYYWIRMPIENVKVSLATLPGFNTTTDDKGFFIIDNIPFGEYQLNIILQGYPKMVKTIFIEPEKILWLNFTYNDTTPVPKLWGNNQFNRKIHITEDIIDKIKIDTNFTLTSNIPLAPETVNSNSIQLIEKSTGEQVEFEEINASENKLSFIINPMYDLRFNSTYQVIYSSELRTFDGRLLFSSNWNYANFTTEPHFIRALSKPIITPPNNAVNTPINASVSIDFPLLMNKSSVERMINATFTITGFRWYNDNMTISLEHEKFEYFTKYTVTLAPGMESANGLYILMDWVNVSFTTVSGLLKYVVGPVKDSNGKPITGVSIVIYDSQNYVVKSSVTNSTGYALFYFEFLLEPGNYTLKLMKAGYDVLTTELMVNETGRPEFPESFPQMKKKKTEEEFSGWLIAGIVLIVILVIILFLGTYFMLFKGKFLKTEPDQKPADEKLIKDKLKEKPQKKDKAMKVPIITTPSEDKTLKPELQKKDSLKIKIEQNEKANGKKTEPEKPKPSSADELLKKVKSGKNSE